MDEYASTFKKGSREWELHEEILNKDYGVLIEKNWPGSFSQTPLRPYLKENNIESLAICGYMTHMCCDSTARQAMHLGYEVEFISDATGTIDLSNYAGDIKAKDLHNAILITQAAKFSRVMSTDDWIRSLEYRNIERID